MINRMNKIISLGIATAAALTLDPTTLSPTAAVGWLAAASSRRWWCGPKRRRVRTSFSGDGSVGRASASRRAEVHSARPMVRTTQSRGAAPGDRPRERKPAPRPVLLWGDIRWPVRTALSTEKRLFESRIPSPTLGIAGMSISGTTITSASSMERGFLYDGGYPNGYADYGSENPDDSGYADNPDAASAPAPAVSSNSFATVEDVPWRLWRMTDITTIKLTETLVRKRATRSLGSSVTIV